MLLSDMKVLIENNVDALLIEDRKIIPMKLCGPQG